MPPTASLSLPWSSSVPRINLGVGEVVVVDQPTILWTVLGSCVAVILRVPRLELSAMCHAQLPEPGPGTGPSCIDACPSPCDREPPRSRTRRYVTCCLRSMFMELHGRGTLKAEIVASVYGGANVVSLITPNGSVGERNLEIAYAMLAKEGIPVVLSDVGGTQGRSIEHDSGTNRTVVRYHASQF
jgi:chemotaxis protein CheD